MVEGANAGQAGVAEPEVEDIGLGIADHGHKVLCQEISSVGIGAAGAQRIAVQGLRSGGRVV